MTDTTNKLEEKRNQIEALKKDIAGQTEQLWQLRRNNALVFLYDENDLAQLRELAETLPEMIEQLQELQTEYKQLDSMVSDNFFCGYGLTEHRADELKARMAEYEEAKNSNLEWIVYFSDKYPAKDLTDLQSNANWYAEQIAEMKFALWFYGFDVETPAASVPDALKVGDFMMYESENFKILDLNGDKALIQNADKSKQFWTETCHLSGTMSDFNPAEFNAPEKANRITKQFMKTCHGIWNIQDKMIERMRTSGYPTTQKADFDNLMEHCLRNEWIYSEEKDGVTRYTLTEKGIQETFYN